MISAKILVVDDEENYRHLFFRTLKKGGYQVRTAVNGEDAIRLLENELFDLALIDIRMSPTDGFSLLEKVKKAYPRMKNIMISAFSTPDTHTRSFKLGADYCLIKPVEISELKEVIKSTLSPGK
ncbi:MAG TPA: response regulator [Nitrospiria bacterium]|nr:response regulator [Nitrospiria bacterium]